MDIVVLPFNAGPDSRAPIARQIANFAVDIVRGKSEKKVNAANLMARVNEGGTTKFALVNPGEQLNEEQIVQDFFKQSKATTLVEGFFEESGEGGKLTVRFWDKDSPNEPREVNEYEYADGESNQAFRKWVERFAREAGAELGEERQNDEGLFGTANAKAFEKFLEGYDAVYFLERSQGNVVSQFDPEEPLNALLGALEEDSGWESPYRAAVQLCRLGIQYRVGKAELYERTLKTLIEKVPESAMAYIPLGELYQSANAPGRAAETYEKAHEIEPNEPAILTRLGLAQAAAGMPVNAERNLKKAVEMEGPEKPSMDFLGQVLQQQGRGHELPSLWKKVVDANPDNANARAKYAVALANAGKVDEAEKAFEEGLEATNGSALVKRFYAPLLRQKKEYDRAMDLYEDVLDEQPTEVPVMLEYAQTLQEGERQIDVPPVLNDVLKANPDPNTRAQVQAWLIEIEQTNRVEKVKEASEKVQAGDAQAAIDILTPMKNWLADYWKMWVVLAGAYNKEEHPEEAQEAAQKALEIFPACEPAFLELNGALTQQGRHEDAYNLLTQAQQALPQSINIAINRALAAKRSGRNDEARRMAQQIKQVAGDKNEQLNKVLQELES